jgi:hypothetical protein
MPPVKDRFGLALNLIPAALVLAAAGIVLFMAAERPRYLEIRDASSGRMYGRWPLEEGGEFAVEFVHSVNQTPVREIFKARGREIPLTAVRFFSLGAGMQSDLEEGQRLSRDGDALVISGYDRSFGELNYIVGTVSDHLLLINGETVSLRDLCGRNAHIKIQIR